MSGQMVWLISLNDQDAETSFCQQRSPLLLGLPILLFTILSLDVQGQSHRIQVEVKSVQESGTLPLMEETILSVAVGCVQIRHIKSPKSHENYQVEDSYCCIPKQLSVFMHIRQIHSQKCISVNHWQGTFSASVSGMSGSLWITRTNKLTAFLLLYVLTCRPVMQNGMVN